MKNKWLLCWVVAGCIVGLEARGVDVEVDAGHVVVQADRGKLLGVNIAVYNSPDEFIKAMEGPISDLATSLVRMPGGSVSDKYYWNGNGVVSNGVVDSSKYKDGYWEVDFSEYRPGFAVDNDDWSKADPGFINIDAKTMHEATRLHPTARNLVTINMGTGTAELAAEWVRWANIKNDYDVKYWELGNELNGEWEAGHTLLDGSKMTAEKYVERYVEFAKAMKAVDPTIKIGGPSCDVEHHDDYFEPLLRDAGEHVDFITLHYYSLRSSLAPEKELFDGLDNMGPVARHMNELIEKYQPERKDEIEISITEWNSKLPKDQDAYRLFNGLWFSAWVGEMLKAGVDSATVWDMFSGEDNGHGLLVQQEDGYVPTGRYWAFWLWSHYMDGALVETHVEENEDLHIYATRDADTLHVMVMNESRSASYPVELAIRNFRPGKVGKEVTFSSREYFWNPYAHEVEWNSGPSVKPFGTSRKNEMLIPPYCVKIFEFKSKNAAPEVAKEVSPVLSLLLPETEFADLPVEGWVRVLEEGTDKAYAKDIGTVHLSVEGPAEIETPNVALGGAAARFVLKPTGPGPVVVKAECGSWTTEKTIEFNSVDFEEQVVWDFESGAIEEPISSAYSNSVVFVPGSSNQAVRIDFSDVVVQHPNNHIFDLLAYPKGIQKERIGGVIFDILVPEGLELDPSANVQAVLQSHGAYWIPCGQIQPEEGQGEWRTVRLEIPEKNVLKVMDQAFSLLFLMSTEKPLDGSVYLDNIGFMLRPE
jgi:alpha-L-arabinofuranosidase